ncbi:CTP synthase [Bienertia sinuspersici]
MLFCFLQPLLDNTKEKLSQFYHVPAENIFNVHDVPKSKYLAVPLLLKALLQACIACSMKPTIDWVAASDLEDESAKSTPDAHASAWKTLKNASCVLVPGGFGDCGVNGMILAAKDMGNTVNPNFVGALEDGDLKFVGSDDTGERMEILELPGHPYFIQNLNQGLGGLLLHS